MVTGIFIYRLRRGIDEDEYQAEAFRMFERVSSNPEFGLLDFKAYAGPDGESVLIASFESLEGVQAWRNDLEHLEIQERGRAEWYESYWGGRGVRHYEFDRQTGRHDLSSAPDA